MADYISREAILSEFENRFCVFCPNEKCVETCKLAYIKHAIQGINAADVRPVVHGKWVKQNPGNKLGDMTNADRIRQMSDEHEMAKMIYWIVDNIGRRYTQSVLGVADWLKQEVTDNG